MLRRVNFLFEQNGKSFMLHQEKWIRNTITEETKWQNVQNAERKSPNQRKHGKWLEDQTNRANECNWK